MSKEATPIPHLAKRAKVASQELAVQNTEKKNAALHFGAELLEGNAASLLSANAVDVAEATQQQMPTPLVDRLRLDHARIEAMANGLRQVAGLADPIGEVSHGWVRPNGLRIEKMRVPLGVVAIIYESRPNVTSDAFGLCCKSSNAAFLRGSSTAINSNLAIAAVLRDALAKAELPVDSLVVVDDTRRGAAIEFMQQNEYIDCLIPRGGAGLIQSIVDHATVPYVLDGAGNCHVYVDAAADLEMALNILRNAKTQRTGVCNAAESLVVHKAVAREFLPLVVDALSGVELVGDQAACEIAGAIAPGSEEDFATEYLGMKMSVKLVDGLQEAIAHVQKYSTGHSEAIVTNDLVTAQKFVREVDAAAVLVNASTRFVDGEEFGFGAEIGISTQKLHARGPMGLEQLTTYKYVVHGQGHIRG